ncbi:MAG: NUDIX hydrolase [Candidatus Sericytochromatia bacterium]|nr:NUDIX hydrolase [Candidatus Sericytochromatia bacterium]
MTEQDLTERGLTREGVFKGRLLSVRVDTVALPDGRTAQREVVEHPGAVAVLPVAQDGTLLLVRQFRYAVGAMSLELPAGCLDRPGEPLEAAARRELREETGHDAARWTYLGRFHSSPGVLGETVHLWLAEGLTAGAPSPDEDEWVAVVPMALSEALEAIQRGEIRDAKTVVGLLWLARFGQATKQQAPQPPPATLEDA